VAALVEEAGAGLRQAFAQEVGQDDRLEILVAVEDEDRCGQPADNGAATGRR
jgi:hypothetical protein